MRSCWHVPTTVCTVILGVMLASPSLFGQIPKKISYQGVLTTGGGTPVADGSYNFEFALYDTIAGGISLWTETQTGVSAQRGTFSTILGSSTPINAALDRTLYLQVTATGGPPGPSYPLTFSPRSELSSAPYALAPWRQTGNSISYVAGNVGIGQTSPAAKLDIGGTAGVDGIRFPDGTLQTTAAATGAFLPLAGGSMSGSITNIGDPPISMGKGNFGTGNVNTGSQAFVAGSNNRVRGNYSTVGGGGGGTTADSNSAYGDYSAVSGGTGNKAGAYATVGGGYFNLASGTGAFVGGGSSNTANGMFNSTVSGGYANLASGQDAAVAGGQFNIGSGLRSFVGGGSFNTARGGHSAVLGGGGPLLADSNSALGNNSTVGGGSSNVASGRYSTVPGGYQNRAAGNHSLAIGRRAKANHLGSFVWADSSADADFASTAPNQFLIRSSGGVGIGMNSPESPLVVQGLSNWGVAEIVGAGTYTESSIGFRPSNLLKGALGTWVLGVNNNAGPLNAFSLYGANGLGAGSQAMTVTTSLNVGFGTPTPTKKLEVIGSARVTDTLFSSSISSNGPLRLQTAGTTRVYVDTTGNVGIGTTGPGSLDRLYVVNNSTSNSANAVHGHISSTTPGGFSAGVRGENSGTGGLGIGVYGSQAGGGWGVYGVASSGYGVYGYSSTGVGVYGSGATAGIFSGNVTVTGTLSKGGGAFKIDHPLDPANKYLYHSFVESPDMKNVYDGIVTLDAKGEATITLPDWFEALNKEFRYQLTCIGDFAQVYVAQKISGSRFKIAGGKAGLEVSWQVTGIRKDAFAEKHRIPLEEVKKAGERGRYMHPEAFGLPTTMGLPANQLPGNLKEDR